MKTPILKASTGLFHILLGILLYHLLLIPDPLKAQTMPVRVMDLPLQRAVSTPKGDWLLRAPDVKASVSRSADGSEVHLDNGLIGRVFRLSPNVACTAFDNHRTGRNLLRSVRPEATLDIDGNHYAVGGLVGQPDLAYLTPEWLERMPADPGAFRYTGLTVGKTSARFPYNARQKRSRRASELPWPPPGVSLTLHFAPPAGLLTGVRVDVHYEMYDGLPLLAKWLTVHNDGAKSVRLNRFVAETLGTVEREGLPESSQWEAPNLTVVTDYAFDGMTVIGSNKTVFWVADPNFSTQVNYELKTPCVLEVRPPLGPDVDIAPGRSLDTFRVFELAHDSTDQERRGLGIRRLFRTLAPWCADNPLMLHLTSTDPKVVRNAIDQCAEVGFELVIFSFGSGLNMEDASPDNIARFKEFADYAHGKGIRIGGYSLLASRSISEKDDVINPKTGKTGGARFDNSPCLGSAWGIAYFEHVKTFLRETGFDLLEHDGSYPGDVCASTTHPGHYGLEDSQWTQYQQITDFYHWCREHDIYLNVPDWYFLAGSNKTGMGYRETNWSLPRAQQMVHARQNLFDGTWDKIPSMGWMFTPLVQYHGGGAAATIEPLHEHLSDYEQHLANNLGYGAQACYRGPRLYDTPETKALVIKWVRFFNQHRQVLESDVIHLRRADGRDLDTVLHANPRGVEKGLLMVYNPTPRPITKELTVPLYYTGLTTRASIREQDDKPYTVLLDRAYDIRLNVTVPANGVTWFVIR